MEIDISLLSDQIQFLDAIHQVLQNQRKLKLLFSAWDNIYMVTQDHFLEKIKS